MVCGRTIKITKPNTTFCPPPLQEKVDDVPHGHLVVTVHEPDQVGLVTILSRGDYLAARTIDSSDYLPPSWAIPVLHTAPTHHKAPAIIALQRHVDEVTSRDKSSTTITCHLYRGEWVNKLS